MREPSDSLIEAVAVASEICGTQLSKPAAKAFAIELAQFDEAQVTAALRRCMHELKGRLTLSEVLSRIDDGRPTALEAWGRLVWDEDSPYSPTDEMAVAQGECRSLYFAGDKVGAKMLFVEAYQREVLKNRADRKPMVVTESLAQPALTPFTSREERDRAYERKMIERENLEPVAIPAEVRKQIAGALKREVGV